MNILLGFLKEFGLSMIGKIGWKVVGERFASRLVLYGLEKLKNYSTNDVVDSTVDDIIASLKGKKLSVIDNA